MRNLFAGCLLVLLAASTALADPVGKFTVDGANADGSGAYRGKIDIRRNGETYKAVWVVGDTTFTGTGIGGTMADGAFKPGPASSDDTAISILFRAGKDVGLAVYAEQPDGSWKGSWTYENLDRVAFETWTPKNGLRAAPRSIEPKALVQTAPLAPMPSAPGPKP